MVEEIESVIRILLLDISESLNPHFEMHLRMHAPLHPTLFHRDLRQRDVRKRGCTN
jgi:hypothetical protein